MEEIDIVIPWVDDSDLNWIAERKKYLSNFDEKPNRLAHYFRDWDTLRYVFRGIEENMPWVRNIHFITCGHLPEWLNINHPKLKIHFHKDFFSGKSQLPTFSSHPIEMNLKNIPGLAEKFIYFNDDTLIVKPVNQDRFFQNNLPVDYLVLDIPRGGWLYNMIRIKESYSAICRNSINLINKKFPLKKLKKEKPNLFLNQTYSTLDKLRNIVLGAIGEYKWIKVNHHPQAYLLKHLKECYMFFGDVMDETSKHRFRTYEDVNQYLYRNYSLMTGQFVPHFYDDAFCFALTSLTRYKRERNNLFEKTLVCLNDSPFLKASEYPELKKNVINDLNLLFPRKSEFEL